MAVDGPASTIHKKRRCGIRALFAFSFLFGFCFPPPSQGALLPVPSKEYQVKAVFLYQFVQFVDWPESTFASPEAPLVIGVLGTDPFGGYLDMVIKGEKKDMRPITVRRIAKAEDLDNCQILFIGSRDSVELARIFSGLRVKPVLTVGESEPFARLGGMIRFYTDQSRIRLKINLETVQAARLAISYKLLKLAKLDSADKG